MKIIKAGYEFINEPSITKKIERIARLCYKSEDKIGEGTDIAMLSNLMKRQHLAMLEHGDICMEVSDVIYDLIDDAIHTIENNLSEVNGTCFVPKKIFLRRTMTTLNDGRVRYLISGNIRAWYEFFLEASPIGALPSCMVTIVNGNLGYILNNSPLTGMSVGVDEEEWEVDLSHAFCQQVTDYTVLTFVERMVHETISIQFTVDRGVTHELVRHRPCSFAQESTRYCNYNLGKFGNEITVIEPCFYVGRDDEYNAWVSAMEDAEKHYFDLINAGSKPQEARDVLPTSVKAEIVMTANLREWRHIFALRACDLTGPAHPQMKEVMIPCFKDLRAGTYAFAFDDMLAADEVHA